MPRASIHVAGDCQCQPTPQYTQIPCLKLSTGQTQAPTSLGRLTIGAMFVWVLFENLGKGLYTFTGYAGFIHGYIEHGRALPCGRALWLL